MSFKDHFSGGSANYAAFRPGYPPALFEWLAGQCNQHDLAWDCGTGSGQAAVDLAPHFRRVIATDASAQQIQSARSQAGVEYGVAAAESSALEDACVDLLTVAQAAHWFVLECFYAEAKRVLRAQGVIALWGYGRLVLPAALDEPLAHFYEHIVGPCWPPERVLIDEGYRSLAFPFKEIAAPRFSIEVCWTLPRLIAYLSTWSAVERHIEANDCNPLIPLENELAARWDAGKASEGRDGLPETALRIEWPLFLRVGRT
ncbi:MAG: class I SAM-dependent methyltransferase [Thiobacillaceae bacterium]